MKRGAKIISSAPLTQQVEYLHGKQKVAGSNPAEGSHSSPQRRKEFLENRKGTFQRPRSDPSRPRRWPRHFALPCLRQGKTRQGMAWQGLAKAWQGMARPGKAWPGMARHGKAWPKRSEPPGAGVAASLARRTGWPSMEEGDLRWKMEGGGVRLTRNPLLWFYSLQRMRRRQVVRQRVLIPPFRGSNPFASEKFLSHPWGRGKVVSRDSH